MMTIFFSRACPFVIYCANHTVYRKNFQVELEVSELKTEQIATVNKIVELIQRQTGLE